MSGDTSFLTPRRSRRRRASSRVHTAVVIAGGLCSTGLAGQDADVAPSFARLMSIPSDSISFMVGGIVVSAQTGEPLGGAQVFVSGSFIGTQADRRGRFRLDLKTAGLRQIVVRLLGFPETCVNVDFRENMMQGLRIGVSGPPPPRERLDPRDPPSVEMPELVCIDPEQVPYEP